MFIEAPLNSIS